MIRGRDLASSGGRKLKESLKSGCASSSPLGEKSRGVLAWPHSLRCFSRDSGGCTAGVLRCRGAACRQGGGGGCKGPVAGGGQV